MIIISTVYYSFGYLQIKIFDCLRMHNSQIPGDLIINHVQKKSIDLISYSYLTYVSRECSLLHKSKLEVSLYRQPPEKIV